MASPNSSLKLLGSYQSVLTRAAFALVLLMQMSLSYAQSLPSIEDTVANANRMQGYFNLYWDDSTGKMYWEIDKLDTEFLYQVSMGSGLGSNPLGRSPPPPGAVGASRFQHNRQLLHQ